MFSLSANPRGLRRRQRGQQAHPAQGTTVFLRRFLAVNTGVFEVPFVEPEPEQRENWNKKPEEKSQHGAQERLKTAWSPAAAKLRGLLKSSGYQCGCWDTLGLGVPAAEGGRGGGGGGGGGVFFVVEGGPKGICFFFLGSLFLFF